ncbi:MAG: hypothetical protein EA417_17705 [Gammaproteobacteria bacterium]|nr:MAG: hypothetical protein EA417_17705 [Gammaproteobacteria bacterium]
MTPLLLFVALGFLHSLVSRRLADSIVTPSIVSTSTILKSAVWLPARLFVGWCGPRSLSAEAPETALAEVRT